MCWFCKTCLVLLLCCFLFPSSVRGEEVSTLVRGQMERLGVSKVSEQTRETLEEAGVSDITFGSILEDILTGEFSISPKSIFNFLGNRFFGEVKGQFSMIRNLIILLLFSGLLKNIGTTFQGKSVSEMGFYVCYMVLILEIMGTFYHQVSAVSGVLLDMKTMFLSLLPVLVTLSATSGAYAQVAILAPALLGGTGFVIFILTKFMLPGITLATSLAMVNQFTEKPLLGKMTELFQGVIAWGMKGLACGFMLLFSLQKVGTVSMNHFVGKTAKAVVGAVPVVGDVMGGAVESAAAMMGMFRSGTLVAVFVVLLLLCAVPLCNLLVMIFVYRVVAAVAERLVKCLCAAGDFSVLLLGALFLAEVVFLFSAVLLLLMI